MYNLYNLIIVTVYYTKKQKKKKKLTKKSTQKKQQHNTVCESVTIWQILFSSLRKFYRSMCRFFFIFISLPQSLNSPSLVGTRHKKLNNNLLLCILYIHIIWKISSSVGNNKLIPKPTFSSKLLLILGGFCFVIVDYEIFISLHFVALYNLLLCSEMMCPVY